MKRNTRSSVIAIKKWGISTGLIILIIIKVNCRVYTTQIQKRHDGEYWECWHGSEWKRRV